MINLSTIVHRDGPNVYTIDLADVRRVQIVERTVMLEPTPFLEALIVYKDGTSENIGLSLAKRVVEEIERPIGKLAPLPDDAPPSVKSAARALLNARTIIERTVVAARSTEAQWVMELDRAALKALAGGKNESS